MIDQDRNQRYNYVQFKENNIVTQKSKGGKEQVWFANMCGFWECNTLFWLRFRQKNKCKTVEDVNHFIWFTSSTVP